MGIKSLWDATDTYVGGISFSSSFQKDIDFKILN
jgi:hypothetical protein